jgi:hypothetical protein
LIALTAVDGKGRILRADHTKNTDLHRHCHRVCTTNHGRRHKSHPAVGSDPP